MASQKKNSIGGDSRCKEALNWLETMVAAQKEKVVALKLKRRNMSSRKRSIYSRCG